MNAVLILNHQAGSLNGERDAVTPSSLRDAFHEQGVNVAVQRVVPRTLAPAVHDAIARRVDAVLVGGGDGTISTAAGILAGTGMPLGVVPLGTFNHFARDLGLPVDWREAVRVLAHAERRAVDVGEVNGRVFINNCSLGSYPDAVRRREALRDEHGRAKWLAMAIASFEVFRRLRRLRVRIETSDMELMLRTPFVFVGNNRYTGHLLARDLRPRLDEGQLWIYTTRAHRRLTLLRLLWQSLLHSIDEADALEAHAVTEASIFNLSERPLPVALDGELVALTPPLRFRIRPRGLQVLAPPAPAAR